LELCVARYDCLCFTAITSEFAHKRATVGRKLHHDEPMLPNVAFGIAVLQREYAILVESALAIEFEVASVDVEVNGAHNSLSLQLELGFEVDVDGEPGRRCGLVEVPGPSPFDVRSR